jgi:homoserine O-acetyltransferase
MRYHVVLFALAARLRFAHAQDIATQAWPSPTPGVFSIPNFSFDSGETLDSLDIHYQTLGKLEISDDGRTNAVHIMHGSIARGDQLLTEEFAGSLFNAGQILDADKYFIILRDGIGHGNSSGPRNTGLHARFPSYQYNDMVRADHQLLTEHLGVNHTRLVMGVSMGGMHTWMWGEMYPDFMDALMPIASLPVEIAGHNRLWRKTFIDLIRSDPAWENGEYASQPLVSLLGAMGLLQVMFQGQELMQREYPTRNQADNFFAQSFEAVLAHPDDYDVNDQIYAWNASWSYDPEPELEKIRVPLTAVNTADDLMNPPQLGILEKLVHDRMVRGLGRAVVVPTSNATFGHGSYIKASLWVDELASLLDQTIIPRVARG